MEQYPEKSERGAELLAPATNCQPDYLEELRERRKGESELEFRQGADLPAEFENLIVTLKLLCQKKSEEMEKQSPKENDNPSKIEE